MKKEFDYILKWLMSEMPEHTPKTDVWQNINEKLDEDASISRMREILKQNEHAPKQGLWDNIETELNKSHDRRTFFFKILLSLFVIISSVLIYFTLHRSPDSITAKTSFRYKNKIFSNRLKSANQDNNDKHILSSGVNKNNSALFDSSSKKKQDLLVSNSIGRTTKKTSDSFRQNNNNINPKSHIVPAQTLEDWLKNKDSTDNITRSNNSVETKAYSISGKMEWEMIKKGYVSLCLYGEEGNLITSIFEKKKFDIGEQSFDFKVINCKIEKNKKYILRLMIKNVVIKEMVFEAE